MRRSETRLLIARYLSGQQLPFRYTMGDLVQALDLNPAEEFKRRHRELRELGWQILTYREDPSLEAREYLLTRIGGMP